MKFEVKIETEPAMRAYREVRREIRQDVKKVLYAVGQARALPVARAVAPGILRPQVALRATASDVFLTSTGSGWKRARFWYLNWGGQIKAPLIGKRGPIPIMKPGSDTVIAFRMAVKRPRRFRGLRFLEKARDQVSPAIRAELEHRIPLVIQGRLDKYDVFKTRVGV